MDIEKVAHNEVFRPLVGVLIPGAVAVAPYVLIAERYVPQIVTFWHDHDSAFVALVLACMLAAGLAIEDLGALIEYALIDRLLERRRPGHSEEWNKYLQLKMRDEYVGQRYIRHLVTRLNFELSMGPALICLWFGLYWIQRLYSTWTSSGFASLSAFVLIMSVFMFWQCVLTAKALSRTRALLLAVFPCDPLRGDGGH